MKMTVRTAVEIIVVITVVITDDMNKVTKAHWLRPDYRFFSNCIMSNEIISNRVKYFHFHEKSIQRIGIITLLHRCELLLEYY